MFFKKIWAFPGLFFVYFRSFLIPISIIKIESSIDGVLQIRTRGHRMVVADKTTELWWPLLVLSLSSSTEIFKINLGDWYTVKVRG